MTVWLGSWGGRDVAVSSADDAVAYLWPHGLALLIPPRAHALHVARMWYCCSHRTPARMHLLHVCVPAPSPRRPARGDASPATPHAPRVVTHVAHACACARVDSSSRPPPRRAYMAHAHACEARLSLLRNLTLRVWWPTSRMHGACVRARISAGGPAPLGKEALRVSGHGDPAPPQPISSLSRPGGYLPLGRNGSLLSTTGGLRSNRSWAPRGSARMRLTGPTGPDGLGTVGCAAGIGKWGL